MQGDAMSPGEASIAREISHEMREQKQKRALSLGVSCFGNFYLGKLKDLRCFTPKERVAGNNILVCTTYSITMSLTKVSCMSAFFAQRVKLIFVEIIPCQLTELGSFLSSQPTHATLVFNSMANPVCAKLDGGTQPTPAQILWYIFFYNLGT